MLFEVCKVRWILITIFFLVEFSVIIEDKPQASEQKSQIIQDVPSVTPAPIIITEPVVAQPTPAPITIVEPVVTEEKTITPSETKTDVKSNQETSNINSNEASQPGNNTLPSIIEQSKNESIDNSPKATINQENTTVETNPVKEANSINDNNVSITTNENKAESSNVVSIDVNIGK